MTIKFTCKQQKIDKDERKLTISLHFFIVSRFPRLRTAFRALAEKLSDDNVSDKFEAFGQTLRIIKVFEVPPTGGEEKRIDTLETVY